MTWNMFVNEFSCYLISDIHKDYITNQNTREHDEWCCPSDLHLGRNNFNSNRSRYYSSIGSNKNSSFLNEDHQEDTIHRVLWYSDWLRNCYSAARDSFFQPIIIPLSLEEYHYVAYQTVRYHTRSDTFWWTSFDIFLIPACIPTWMELSQTASRSSLLSYAVPDVDTCKKICLATPNCVAVSLTTSKQCWLDVNYGLVTLKRVHPDPSCTQYVLINRCPCYSGMLTSWTLPFALSML